MLGNGRMLPSENALVIIMYQIALKFFSKDPTDNKSALAEARSLYRTGFEGM